MDTDGRITRIGDGLFIEIPPETLRDSGLSEGQAVRVVSESGAIKVEPDGDENFAKDFATGFTVRYDEALRNLSNR